MTSQEAINLGLQHHQAGNLAEAESLYRAVLAQQPNHPDVMHLVGVVVGQRGQHQASLDFIGRALNQQPNRADYLGSFAITLSAMGRLDEAANSYRKAISIDPKSSRAFGGLATVLARQGQPQHAIECLRKAISIEPNCAEFYFNLGNVVMGMGRVDDAIPLYDLAVRMDHSRPDFHNNLGSAYRRKGNINMAIAWHAHAVALKPDFADALCFLGEALYQKGDYEKAESMLRRALLPQPKFGGALLNLGNTLRRAGRYNEAVVEYQKALAVQPKWPEANNNLGNTWRDMHEWDKAAACYLAAVQLQSDYAPGNLNLGQIHLLRGELEKGWPLYEWRRKIPGTQMVADVPGPHWDGGDLKGKRILLHAEQGLGDTIQFVRYVPMVAARGGKVILATQGELFDWVSTIEGVDQKMKVGHITPSFDVQCPLLSLPRMFKTSLETIPAKVPYLAADAAKKEKWKSRLGAAGDGLRIGISWAGSKAHPNDQNRSFTLLTMGPLAAARGDIKFFSLQMGEAAREAAWIPQGMDLTDLSGDIADFSDTAAIVDQLDLVITADTSLAHVAGALAKPVWVLLPMASDWRWLLDRSDSPWYPTMRLLRQTKLRDWESPMREAAEALKDFSGILS